MMNNAHFYPNSIIHNTCFYILSITLLCFLISGCDKNKITCKGILCKTGFESQEMNGKCECVRNKEAIFIASDITWNPDSVYILEGKVVVKSGVTLTIEPGTIIKGAKGTGSLASALIVSRGAKIIACGTPDLPIVMTSIEDNIKKGQRYGTNLNENQNGLWGGLIVLGNAPGSFEGGISEFQIEGIPGDDTFGLYGGDIPDDSSGRLCYISIRHGGTSIGNNNEINGLTLGGVGSRTVLENIEVVGNLDDGIEFFGGTVNVTNALVWAQGDDAFDIDQAYRGTVDNFVYIAGQDSDHGLEIDGPEGPSSGSFVLRNGTLKGLNAEIADFRDGATGVLQDCKIFNFSSEGDIEIDDDETSRNFFSGDLRIMGLQFVGTRSVSDFCTDTSASADEAAFDENMEMNNSVVTRATVGADVSVFAWTFAFQKGALADF